MPWMWMFLSFRLMYLYVMKQYAVHSWPWASDSCKFTKSKPFGWIWFSYLNPISRIPVMDILTMLYCFSSFFKDIVISCVRESLSLFLSLENQSVRVSPGSSGLYVQLLCCVSQHSPTLFDQLSIFWNTSEQRSFLESINIFAICFHPNIY